MQQSCNACTVPPYEYENNSFRWNIFADRLQWKNQKARSKLILPLFSVNARVSLRGNITQTDICVVNAKNSGTQRAFIRVFFFILQLYPAVKGES